MSEAKRDRAGGGVSLVAAAICGLLGRRAVVAKSVGLDDEAKGRPVEVDPVAVDVLLGPWPR